MTKAASKSDGWSAVRRELISWDNAALLTLVKDLYEANASNRDFVEARCQTAASSIDVLQKYRAKVVEHFYPSRGYGRLKLGEARKAIREYRKATGSIPGTAELLMTYVENGTQFTRDFGDIDERFYRSLESALSELSGLLYREEPQLYPQFKERLAAVGQMATRVGYFVSDVVSDLEADLGES